MGTHVEGEDIEALERIQRPIHFGGVQLPELHISDLKRWTPAPMAVGPAGEETLLGRIITISRTALAARIKHGVPMAELLHHVHMICDAEEALLD
jgi:hypothetical protein